MAAKQVIQLRIVLEDTNPPIWRRIQLEDCSLDKLHGHIQCAMGWKDSHLHQFTASGTTYGIINQLAEDKYDAKERGLVSSRRTRVSQLISELSSDAEPGSSGSDDTDEPSGEVSFKYEYDFGDGWEHRIIFEGYFPRVRGKRYPRVHRRRTCLPSRRLWGAVELPRVRHEGHGPGPSGSQGRAHDGRASAILASGCTGSWCRLLPGFWRERMGVRDDKCSTIYIRERCPGSLCVHGLLELAPEVHGPVVREREQLRGDHGRDPVLPIDPEVAVQQAGPCERPRGPVSLDVVQVHRADHRVPHVLSGDEGVVVAVRVRLGKHLGPHAVLQHVGKGVFVQRRLGHELGRGGGEVRGELEVVVHGGGQAVPAGLEVAAAGPGEGELGDGRVVGGAEVDGEVLRGVGVGSAKVGVLHAERLKDVLFEVLAERLARDLFHNETEHIDIMSIQPVAPRLEDDGRLDDALAQVREDGRQPLGLVEFCHALVPPIVAEPRRVRSQLQDRGLPRRRHCLGLAVGAEALDQHEVRQLGQQLGELGVGREFPALN